MASMPPNRFQGGPPPGAMPQRMSAMHASPLRPDQSNPEPQGGGAGIARMFYAIERSLDSLASAIPDQSDQIDKIKSSLREVLAQAVSGGAAFVGGEEKNQSPISGPSEPLI